ncbi:MAG: sugar ABC transporter ATP-binding protein [Thaumarchaeota archaeon]|nr:sugar ABC transporter ATP-binding protein [Nitrososphaerota archaeon]
MPWEIRNFSKKFGAVIALSNVSIVLDENTVYGLVGANGSGKSTLIKALTGVISLDSGELYENGVKRIIKSPFDAHKYGIHAAYQDLSLAPHLSVLENLLLGIRDSRSKINDVIRYAMEIFRKLAANIPLDEKVESLTQEEKAIVELTKLFIRKPRLALLDEPTSYLTLDKVGKLFELINELKKSTTIVFVSHRLDEVFKICDKIIVLRDGKKVFEADAKETSVEVLIDKMVGETKKTKLPTLEHPTQMKVQEKAILTIENFSAGKIKNFSLKVSMGEIVGIVGLAGHGQSDLLRSLFGMMRFKGSIRFEGRNLNLKSPEDAIKRGIVYVSGDRNTEGIFPHRSVKENLALIKNASNPLFFPVNERAEEKIASQMVKELSIDCESLDQPASSLSGGNQQKLFLGRGLSIKPKVLILNDPLKGVDIMTKMSFSNKIKKISEECAVIFFSSDVTELLPIASRIVVIFEGRKVAEFSREKLDTEKLLKAMLTGGK